MYAARSRSAVATRCACRCRSSARSCIRSADPTRIVTMSAATDSTYRVPFDRALLLVVPAAAFMLLLFVYPFIYGLLLSFNPKEGGWLGNYRHFFTTDNLWPTIWITLKLAMPATLINVGLALPIA